MRAPRFRHVPRAPRQARTRRIRAGPGRLQSRALVHAAYWIGPVSGVPVGGARLERGVGASGPCMRACTRAGRRARASYGGRAAGRAKWRLADSQTSRAVHKCASAPLPGARARARRALHTATHPRARAACMPAHARESRSARPQRPGSPRRPREPRERYKATCVTRGTHMRDARWEGRWTASLQLAAGLCMHPFPFRMALARGRSAPSPIAGTKGAHLRICRTRAHGGSVPGKLGDKVVWDGLHVGFTRAPRSTHVIIT